MFKHHRQASDVTISAKEKPAGDRVLYRIVLATLMLCLALAYPVEGMAKSKNMGKNKEQPNQKYASMVIDADTGAVISEQYANKTVHPASLTKVMTLLLLFEALESGSVRLSDRIYISQRAANQQPSKLGLAAGSSIRVEDAILAMVTKSANDISVAVAEHLGGSEPRFALRMTRRARDIGMSRTTFKNAHGLHNPGQITTARDMATLARYVIVRYPNYYRYFSTKQFTYRGKTYTNHNRLMSTYPGMDGFKTGFINASGFNLIASAKKNGHRLIGVVFGGRTWKSRNDHMAQLLNVGFSRVGDVRYANAPVAPVAGAVQAPIPVPPQKPVLQAASDVPPSVAEAPQSVEVTTTRETNFTSLSALDSGRKLVVAQAAPPQTLQLPQNYEDNTTERAIESVHTAINRGDYSELTGEGDYDAATTRRVETGLLSAAVYKGEHEKVKQMQAAMTQAGIEPEVPVAAPQTQVAYHPAPAAASDLWSVQIGAYNSRVATDEALRYAHTKLPGQLTHATPIVVPLQTGEGLLFRARLGNFTQAQAVDACRYFRDCLPIAPR